MVQDGLNGVLDSVLSFGGTLEVSNSTRQIPNFLDLAVIRGQIISPLTCSEDAILFDRFGVALG